MKNYQNYYVNSKQSIFVLNIFAHSLTYVAKSRVFFANHVISSTTTEKFPILSEMTCLSSNVIYSITCKKQNGNCKFKPQYIGQTSRRICDRFNEHKNSISLTSTKSVGIHFSSNGHKASDLEIIPIEKVNSKDPWTIISREKYYIKKFDPTLNIRMQQNAVAIFLKKWCISTPEQDLPLPLLLIPYKPTQPFHLTSTSTQYIIS